MPAIGCGLGRGLGLEEVTCTAVDQLAAQACEGALFTVPPAGARRPAAAAVAAVWTPLPAAANASDDDALRLVLRGLPPVPPFCVIM